MTSQSERNDAALGIDYRALLALMRRAPKREQADESLLVLAAKVPSDFGPFFRVLALHDVRRIVLDRYVLDVPKLMSGWRRSAKAKSPRVIPFGHDESGGVYKARIRGAGVTIQVGDAPEEEEGRSEFFSLSSFFADLCSEGALLPEEFLDARRTEQSRERRLALLADPQGLRLRAEQAVAAGGVGLAPWQKGTEAKDGAVAQAGAEDGTEGGDGEDRAALEELRWQAAGCEVAFVWEAGREQVDVIRRDGTRIRLDLPSPGRYRHGAALSPDGTKLAVAAPVRTRLFDLETGRATVVLEGPWQVDVAWLGEGRLAVLTREGRWELDRRDPDVQLLSSLKGTARSGRFVPVESVGRIHVVALGTGEIEESLECRAEHVQGLMDGRVLVVRRSSGEGMWGTAILAFRDGHLTTVAKFEVDIGPVRWQGGSLVSAFGFELLGLPEALSRQEGFGMAVLHDGMELEQPGGESEQTAVTTDEGPLRLVPEGTRPTGIEPHPAVGTLLGKEGWVEPNMEHEYAFALEAVGSSSGGDASRYRALLVAEAATDHPRRLEIRPVQEGEKFVYAHGADGMRLALWAGSWLVEVLVSDGTASPIAMMGSAVHGLAWLTADRIAALVQVLDDKSNLEIYARVEGSRWMLERVLPIEAFDSFAVAPGQGLFALSFKNMPAKDVFSAFLAEQGDGFSFLGRFPLAVTRLWDGEDGMPHVASSGNESFRVEALAPAIQKARQRAASESPPAEPMLALVHDVRQGLFGEREPFGISHGRFGTEHGYIDEQGRWVLEPRFSGGEEFHGDQVVVTVTRHDRRGRIRLDGSWLLPPRFTFIGRIRDGRSRVALGGRRTRNSVEGGLWGLCDEDGFWIVEPFEYGFMGDLRQGLCRVVLGEGRENYMDRHGNVLLDEPVEACRDFSCGRGAVKENGLWGFVDRSGNRVVDCRYSAVVLYREDLAAVRLESGQWAFIDLDGQRLGEETFDECYPPKQGFGVVRKADKWRYVDKEGMLLGKTDFDRAFLFAGGMAPVVVGGKQFYVNEALELLGPGWDQVFQPAEGMGLVRQGDRYGFVDHEGRMVHALNLDRAYSFNEGLALAHSEGKWGYLDGQGKWAVEPRFVDAGLYYGGLAAVKVGDLWGYVDKKGHMAIEPAFKLAYPFSDGHAMVEVPVP